MSLKNTLHYASYLKWVFLLAAIGLIFYSLLVLPDNLISIIGITVFCIGIYMGLDSLYDLEEMSDKEKDFYRNPKYVNTQSTIILVSIIITVIISILFISLRFVFASENNSLFNELFNLGLDCWALILGLLCILKSNDDKRNFANKSKA
jgi:magnesium-transporting ATPase (P-type)